MLRKKKKEEMLRVTYGGIKTEEGWRRKYKPNAARTSQKLKYNISRKSTENKMAGACRVIGWKNNAAPSTTQKTYGKAKEEAKEKINE